MPHIDTTDKSVWLEHGSKEDKNSMLTCQKV